MSISKIGPDWTVIVPKTVRDNLGLFPGDTVLFGDDFELYDVSRVSNCLNRGARVRGQSAISEIRRIAEASPSYDSMQAGTTISRTASLTVPDEVIADLSLEIGEYVVFVRDEVSYWMIPLISPTLIRSGLCPSDITGDAYEDIVMNYVVMITKEARREIGEQMDSICRTGTDDPFPEAPYMNDSAFLDEIRLLFGVAYA